MKEKTDSRKAIRMRTELEIAIYHAIVETWKSTRQVKGNPLEWYTENRLALGFKTFCRRLAYGNWTLEEIESINRDLKNQKVTEEIIKRFSS